MLARVVVARTQVGTCITCGTSVYLVTILCHSVVHARKWWRLFLREKWRELKSVTLPVRSVTMSTVCAAKCRILRPVMSVGLKKFLHMPLRSFVASIRRQTRLTIVVSVMVIPTALTNSINKHLLALISGTLAQHQSSHKHILDLNHHTKIPPCFISSNMLM